VLLFAIKTLERITQNTEATSFKFIVKNTGTILIKSLYSIMPVFKNPVECP